MSIMRSYIIRSFDGYIVSCTNCGNRFRICENATTWWCQECDAHGVVSLGHDNDDGVCLPREIASRFHEEFGRAIVESLNCQVEGAWGDIDAE